MGKLVKKIKAASKPVKNTTEDVQREKKQKLRHKPIKDAEHAKVLEVIRREPDSKEEYMTIEVEGTNERVYKVVIPKGYYKLIPKHWKWTQDRYKAAELIAAGYPITEVANTAGVSRMTIYGWLQHPEFKEHVDGLTLETGWANKRERIAGLNRVTRLLFDKVVNEIDQVRLTDKSIGAVLVAIQTIAKQISQEKEEFVEQSRVSTEVKGAVGVAAIGIDNYLGSKTNDERAQLEAEFNKMGDDIIRSITGEKE